MPWWGWLSLATYLWACVAASRMLAGHFAYRMLATYNAEWYRSDRRRRSPTGEQWMGAWAGALCLAVVWPVVLLAICTPWRIGAEREAKLKAREDAIRQAERELGIGQP